VEITAGRLERADAYLQHTRQRTAPSVERYRRTHADREAAHDDLRRRDDMARLDARYDVVDVSRRRVQALETWRSWANGDDVAVEHLADAVRALTASRPGDAPERSLADSIEAWTAKHNVELNPGVRIETIVRHRGIDLSR
jgi:hypothetical protein